MPPIAAPASMALTDWVVPSPPGAFGLQVTTDGSQL
jgi:hypothetical protein